MDPLPGSSPHGTLLPWTGVDGRDYHCSHADHAGRPKSHPLGPADPTKRFFTFAEANGLA